MEKIGPKMERIRMCPRKIRDASTFLELVTDLICEDIETFGQARHAFSCDGTGELRNAGREA